MTKTVAAILSDAIDRLKSGETIDRILGTIAYEYGRAVRDEIAAEIRKLAIIGYDSRTTS